MASSKRKRSLAKVFSTGRSQAIRIPKEYRFTCDEVLIEREGERLILTPRPKSWRDYFETSIRLSPDFPNEVADTPPEDRDEL